MQSTNGGWNLIGDSNDTWHHQKNVQLGVQLYIATASALGSKGVAVTSWPKIATMLSAVVVRARSAGKRYLVVCCCRSRSFCWNVYEIVCRCCCLLCDRSLACALLYNVSVCSLLASFDLCVPPRFPRRGVARLCRPYAAGSSLARAPPWAGAGSFVAVTSWPKIATILSAVVVRACVTAMGTTLLVLAVAAAARARCCWLCACCSCSLVLLLLVRVLAGSGCLPGLPSVTLLTLTTAKERKLAYSVVLEWLRDCLSLLLPAARARRCCFCSCSVLLAPCLLLVLACAAAAGAHRRRL